MRACSFPLISIEIRRFGLLKSLAKGPGGARDLGALFFFVFLTRTCFSLRLQLRFLRSAYSEAWRKDLGGARGLGGIALNLYFLSLALCHVHSFCFPFF